jgi:hypothetical protein
MTTLKRLLLCLPFAIAVFLNVLMLLADGLQLPHEQVVGYGFAFAAPWNWLLDFLFSSRTLGRGHLWQRELEGYAIFLWIPAALYSLSLWIVLRIFRTGVSRLMSPDQTK